MAAEKEARAAFKEDDELEELSSRLKDLQASQEQMAFAAQSLRAALPRNLVIDGNVRVCALISTLVVALSAVSTCGDPLAASGHHFPCLRCDVGGMILSPLQSLPPKINPHMPPIHSLLPP